MEQRGLALSNILDGNIRCYEILWEILAIAIKLKCLYTQCSIFRNSCFKYDTNELKIIYIRLVIATFINIEKY